MAKRMTAEEAEDYTRLIEHCRSQAGLLRRMDEVCKPRQVSTPTQKVLLRAADAIEELQTAVIRARSEGD